MSSTILTPVISLSLRKLRTLPPGPQQSFEDPDVKFTLFKGIKQKKREPKDSLFFILRHKPDRGYYSGFPCAPTIKYLSLSGQKL